MFFLSVVIVWALLVAFSRKEADGSTCSKNNIAKVYDLQNKTVIIYGAREDGSVMMRPAKGFIVYASDREITEESARTHSGKMEKFDHYQAFMLQVEGTLQAFVAVRVRKNEFSGETTLYHVPEYWKKFKLAKQFVIFMQEFTKLFSFSDSNDAPYRFYDVNTEFFGYRKGLGHKMQFFFKLKNESNVVIAGMKRIAEGHRSLEAEGDTNIKCVGDSGCKWMAKSMFPEKKEHLECIAETPNKFWLTSIYARQDQARLFEFATGTIFLNGFEPIRWNEDVKPVYGAGATFIGVWKSALFAYRVSDPVPKFDRILDLVDSRIGGYKGGGSFTQTGEHLYLFSTSGMETVVALVTASHKVLYKIFNTNTLRKKLIVIPLDRSEMEQFTKAAEEERTIGGLDHDGASGNIIVYAEKELRYYEYRIDMDKNRTSHGMERKGNMKITDSATFERKVSLYSDEPVRSLRLWQLRNGQKLFRRQETIELRTADNMEVILSKNALERLQCLLYLPLDGAPARKPTITEGDFYTGTIFGVVGCSLFVASNRLPNATFPALDKGECDLGAKVRVFSSGPLLTVAWQVSENTAKYFTTVYEIDPNKKKGDPFLHFDMPLSEGKDEISIEIDPKSFDQIYADDKGIHYRVPSDGNCTLRFASSPLSHKRERFYCLPSSAVYPVENMKFEITRTLYNQAKKMVFYEIKIEGGKEISTLVEPTLMHSESLDKEAWKRIVKNWKSEVWSLYDNMLIYRSGDSGEAFVVKMTPNQKPQKLHIPGIRFAGLFTGNAVVKSSTKSTTWVDFDMTTKTAMGTTKEPPPLILDIPLAAVQPLESSVFECPHPIWRPYMIPLLSKLACVDAVLLIIFLAIMLVHRMKIIPARRHYKILRGMALRERKKALRQRALRRLRRLNLLRKRRRALKAAKKQEEDSSSTESISAAQGASGKIDVYSSERLSMSNVSRATAATKTFGDVRNVTAPISPKAVATKESADLAPDVPKKVADRWPPTGYVDPSSVGLASSRKDNNQFIVNPADPSSSYPTSSRKTGNQLVISAGDPSLTGLGSSQGAGRDPISSPAEPSSPGFCIIQKSGKQPMSSPAEPSSPGFYSIQKPRKRSVESPAEPSSPGPRSSTPYSYFEQRSR